MRKVICLMGPTASGKTDLAMRLLDVLPVELISVDSAMVYRGMDIGTAKPSEAELKQAPHALIDICDPTEAYSAATFCEDAHALCEAILSRGKIPLLVGGTMMYFRAFQQGLSELPKADAHIREALLAEAQQKGWPALHGQLAAVDPVTAKKLHPNDAQRIQRALEVYRVTHKPLSEVLKQSSLRHDYEFFNIALFPENRAWLHARIAARFKAMLAAGFLDEVKALRTRWDLKPDLPSMRSVGYRQALAYLDGKYDYATFCEKGIAATRQLAKRQLTWLRTWPDAHFFDPENPDCFDVVLRKLQGC